MARPKKVAEEEDVVEETMEEVVEPTKLTLLAKFKVVDKNDGTKTFPEFKSEGTTAEELLKNLEFPKGINALVTVTVTNGDKEYTKSLAPTRARLILENESIKSVEALKASFRGII